MGPEHPAGDEIAGHGYGDERNRDRENGNAVATFKYQTLTVITVLARIGEVPLERRSSTEEESRLWLQIAKSEAQRHEVPEKPGADPAGTLC
jgi:hypothetical protein